MGFLSRLLDPDDQAPENQPRPVLSVLDTKEQRQERKQEEAEQEAAWRWREQMDYRRETSFRNNWWRT